MHPPWCLRGPWCLGGIRCPSEVQFDDVFVVELVVGVDLLAVELAGPPDAGVFELGGDFLVDVTRSPTHERSPIRNGSTMSAGLPGFKA